jgi:hypothetical protein
MAKRPLTPRSTANDPAEAPAAPKPKRTRAAARPAAQDTPSSTGPSLDDIRRRAYERYQERGGNHGRHFDDWLEAEKELTQKDRSEK